MKKLKKLFEHIDKWSMSIPIGEYRYTGHPTIYKSTTAEKGFQPSERQILIHRYLHRKLSGRCFKFYMKKDSPLYYWRDEAEEEEIPYWTYGYILSINHDNTSRVLGSIRVRYVNAVTLRCEEIKISSSSKLQYEEIEESEWSSILKLFQVHPDKTLKPAT